MFLHQAINNLIESERQRLPHFIPVLMGIGICWYFNLNTEPNFLYILCFGVFSLFCAYATSYKKISLIAFLITFGAIVAQIRTSFVATPMLQQKVGHVTSFDATVNLCEKTGSGIRFTVSDLNKFRLRKVILNWRTDQNIKIEPGTRVRFRALLYPLSGKAFPFAYDFKRQQFFKGISARGFIVSPPKIIQNNNKFAFNILIEKIRYKINSNIERILHGDSAAIAKALITGEKSDISKDIRAKFSNSGTAHLLAISGLHMGIIGFFAFALIRICLCCCLRISQYYDVKKIAAILSLFIVILYLYISGQSVPSIRAFIMHALIIIGILCNREALSMRSIAIAATIILIITPEAIMFPGFQMSFSAVIAIVALYENRAKFSRVTLLSGVLLTTIAASIPTSWFSMFHFNQLTLNSILANIVCVPMMSFLIMPLAMLALFAMLFDIHTFIVILLGYSIDLLTKIVSFSASLPGSHFVMPTPQPISMIIMIFSGLWITLIHNKIRYLGCLGFLIGCITYWVQPMPDIIISPYSVVVGVRTPEGACFNNLQRFKWLSSEWTKSIGANNQYLFKDKVCQKYIKQIDKNYIVNLYGDDIIIGHKDADIFLNPYMKFSRLVYLRDNSITSNQKEHRPWS